MFYSSTYGELEFEAVCAIIIELINESPNDKFDIVVGSDSQNHRKETKFVTAIILRKFGSGGIYFRVSDKVDKITNMKQRITEETSKSIECSLRLKEFFPDRDISVHIDVGRKGRSGTIMNEMISYVTACGFKPIVKPESYAASCIADRYSK